MVNKVDGQILLCIYITIVGIGTVLYVRFLKRNLKLPSFSQPTLKGIIVKKGENPFTAGVPEWKEVTQKEESKDKDELAEFLGLA